MFTTMKDPKDSKNPKTVMVNLAIFLDLRAGWEVKELRRGSKEAISIS